ncbi:hypothetical protein OAB47_00120 [Vicingaceae bacterium]|nr:hypothetical protein [Vicingaceae bacterium]
MKKIIISAITIMFTLFLTAQRSVAVSSSNYIVGAVSKTLEAPIFNTSQNEIEKEWKTLMKAYNGKVKSSKSELAAYNTTLPLSGEGEQTIFFKTNVQDDSTCHIIVGAMIAGKAIYANNSTDLKQIVRSFAYELSKKSTADKLEKAKSELNTLTRKKTTLDRDQERLLRNTERWKQSVADAELKHKENIDDLNATDISIKKSEIVIQAAEKELSEIK